MVQSHAEVDTLPAEIRPARVSDLEGIFALIRRKAIFDAAENDLQLNEEMLRGALFSAAQSMQALVAIVNQAVVGLATYYVIYSSFLGKPGLWLDDLFVADNFRKRGIGKALLSALCASAHARGCARVDWLVATDNHLGRAFYASLGATVFETVRHARLSEREIERLAASV